MIYNIFRLEVRYDIIQGDDKMNNSDIGNIKIYSYLEIWSINLPIRIYANGKLIKRLKRRTVFEYKIKEDTMFTFKFAAYKKATLTVMANDNIDIFLSLKIGGLNNAVVAEGIYRSDPSYKEVKEVFMKKWHNDYIKNMKKDVKKYRLYKYLSIILFLFSYYSLYKFNNFTLTMIIHIISIIGIYIFSRHTDIKTVDKLIFNVPDTWQLDERYYDWVRYKIAPTFEKKYNMSSITRLKVSEITLEIEPYGRDKPVKYRLYFSNHYINLINENNYKYPLFVRGEIIREDPKDKEEPYVEFFDIGEVDLQNNENAIKAFKMMEKALFREEVDKMHEYTIKYYVGTSSSTTTVETVTANSEYNAKQLIINKYSGQEVHILDIKMN